MGNRISNILTLLPSNAWNHVPTLTNPADCASRGLLPEELSFDLWWNGPPWLSADPIQQPPQPMSSLPLGTSELKVSVCAAAPISDEWIEKNFSSYFKLLRVNAWIHRFISNARTGKNKKPKNLSTSLSVSKSSETHLFSLSQNRHFHNEICCLSQGHPLKSHSRVISLNPFIGKDGLLRVGGRLSNSSLSSSSLFFACFPLPLWPLSSSQFCRYNSPYPWS